MKFLLGFCSGSLGPSGNKAVIVRLLAHCSYCTVDQELIKKKIGRLKCDCVFGCLFETRDKLRVRPFSRLRNVIWFWLDEKCFFMVLISGLAFNKWTDLWVATSAHKLTTFSLASYNLIVAEYFIWAGSCDICRLLQHERVFLSWASFFLSRHFHEFENTSAIRHLPQWGQDGDGWSWEASIVSLSASVI